MLSSARPRSRTNSNSGTGPSYPSVLVYLYFWTHSCSHQKSMRIMCSHCRMYSRNDTASWSRWWYRRVRLYRSYVCLRGIWWVWVQLFPMSSRYQCRVQFGWRPQVCCFLRLPEVCSPLHTLVSLWLKLKVVVLSQFDIIWKIVLLLDIIEWIRCGSSSGRMDRLYGCVILHDKEFPKRTATEYWLSWLYLPRRCRVRNVRWSPLFSRCQPLLLQYRKMVSRWFKLHSR